MNDAIPDWKHFELAISEFIAGIDKSAKVTHDAKIPDAQTGHPRQRDVWVEWSLGGHFPAKALISCKYWATPLDQSDIDHFNGEFISSRAQLGIIYSRSGFNERALNKAKALDFHCCMYYDNKPLELPGALSLGLAYHFRPRFRFQVRGDANAYGFATWRDIFSLPAGTETVDVALGRSFQAMEGSGDLEQRWLRARNGTAVQVIAQKSGAPPLTVELQVVYCAFQAKVAYTLVKGSYNITSNHFKGSEATPWIDLKSVEPGPGWTLLDSIPTKVPSPLLVMWANTDPREIFNSYGNKSFP